MLEQNTTDMARDLERRVQVSQYVPGRMTKGVESQPPTMLSTVCAEVDDLVLRSDALLKRQHVLADRIGAAHVPSAGGANGLDKQDIASGMLPLALDKLNYVRRSFTAMEEAMSRLENTL